MGDRFDIIFLTLNPQYSLENSHFPHIVGVGSLEGEFDKVKITFTAWRSSAVDGETFGWQSSISFELDSFFGHGFGLLSDLSSDFRYG